MPKMPITRKSVLPVRKITLYRDDSTVQVVYNNVKSWNWTAGNTVLMLAIYSRPETSREHFYVLWPRERFCWFRDEKGK